MTAAPAVNNGWIVSELIRLLVAERTMSETARIRGESPPDPSLAIVYHEIASADEDHAVAIETIATRYGHTPARDAGGGIGGALGRLKDKVVGLGNSPIDLLAADLAAKASAIHWYAAWVHVFEGTGDVESGRELAKILADEEAHREALRLALVRLVEHGARETGPAAT
jgi:hypothetical protein